jgi:beta-N-acetylhexosaminidase
MILRRILSIFLLVSLALSYNPTVAARMSGSFQSTDPTENARQMLANMTPEERVGQLFLVSFTGSTADQNSQIFDLITNYHTGGVVLQASNDNFVTAPNTVSSAYQLITNLQSAEWQASHALPSGTDNRTPTPLAPMATSTPANYIPLFIGISQDGDGYPNDQILEGLTALPDMMALGATWNPSLAEQVGTVAGQELSSIGFNLFFGPSLDVLESPGSTLGNGLGATVFGGDPYWVGVMGSAYITGLHSGSTGRLMVIADHFPGRGSADRPVGEEPATVRKSLEQLKQIELAPFFSVTGSASTPDSTADGLLVSHIRYQGIQGNIRSITRPVSFDPQALSVILSIPAFATWRAAGGLMVSDDLGSQTVRRFYDPGGQSFFARLVARDAFLAGNDLLFMGNIISTDAPDNYTTVVRSIEFFDQKYREDPAFAQRVDDAVVRILTAKYRAYGEFDPSVVIPPSEGLADIGQSQAVTFEVARESATLVSPNMQDLDTVLPSPPALNDQIVFFTDTRLGSQCSNCTEESMLGVDALQNAILRLYGPKAGGQVRANRLISYTFTSLDAILDGGVGDSSLENSVRQAGWVVINMLDAEPGEPQTTLLRRFLSERQDLLREKRIVVFAFNAPYYLDATNISKLTAYYCLYSKTAPFVEVAARLLFREISPVGSLPVSVVGIGYDLFTATTPDPNQIIGLSMDVSTIPASTSSATPEATPTPSFLVGETVSVRTSVILDHNGHPVPDGTGVRFNISLSGEGGVAQQIDTITTQGLARASFSIGRPGLVEIRAESDPALTSVVMQLDVSGEGFGVTVVAPTPMNSNTPTPEAIVTPEVNTSSPLAQGHPGLGIWFGTMLILGGLGTLAYWFGKRYISTRWAVRWALCIVAGGLVAYTYLAVRLPGATFFLQRSGWLGMMGVVLLGTAVGFGSAYTWRRLSTGSTKQPD